MHRRQFLGGAGIVGASAVLGAPAVHAQKSFKWRMVTTWSPKLDVLQGGAERFAMLCEEMTDGRLQIDVSPAGELVGAFETFDAVSGGTVEMGHSASYYWSGKHPAFQWFTTVPFGMNAQAQNAWIESGGGLALWEELYSGFDIVPVQMGNVGSQMAGWFNQEINGLGDLEGLKFRTPGLGGRVYEELGVSVVGMPMGEAFTALERGVIDAVEVIGPHDDLNMGLQKAAQYYYYPGWHEPGTMTELIVNAGAWESLPSDIRAVVQSAARDVNGWILNEYNARNTKALERLRTEFSDDVDIRKLPQDVLARAREASRDVVEAEADKDPTARKVHERYKEFLERIRKWEEISEKPYYGVVV